MTIDLQSTEAMREFNLEFHWVLRGAGTTRSGAKKARRLLKSAREKTYNSIADRFERDRWFREEKQRLERWTEEDAKALDALANEAVVHQPMSAQERMEK